MTRIAHVVSTLVTLIALQPCLALAQDELDEDIGGGGEFGADTGTQLNAINLSRKSAP